MKTIVPNSKTRKDALDTIRGIIISDFSTQCGKRSPFCDNCIVWEAYHVLSYAIGTTTPADFDRNASLQPLTNLVLNEILTEEKKTRKKRR